MTKKSFFHVFGHATAAGDFLSLNWPVEIEQDE